MQALVFAGTRRIEHRTDVPKPCLLMGTDALVKVSACAICGSDLHPFRCGHLLPSATCSAVGGWPGCQCRPWPSSRKFARLAMAGATSRGWPPARSSATNLWA